MFLTAYQSLFSIAKLADGSKVLIHAGASGVGSEDKAQACQAFGADCAINYQDTDFVAWSKTNISSGYDVIIVRKLT
ncbi:MAG: hypothetical protein RPS47_11845 [Colwellia sp.]